MRQLLPRQEFAATESASITRTAATVKEVEEPVWATTGVTGN
eukprot:CAMPEP_0172896220 /NCGR_PEP_ID=MMETSP1075-20121228/155045_1 /TAXON_ID=2916 /ORGANISM="Ceratium fusus, Strain PA161109" /LENGTH=41 /DNA_ID= /DNA_START= /DNA_END= /DNA_ORIENTATION=